MKIGSLPRDAKTLEPIPPREQPGYYPGFSTLDQKNHWDALTRALVLRRVHEVPSMRFFDEKEAETLKAALDRILPQDDRVDSRRIPILNYIDERLHEKRFEGYTLEGMPEEDEAHRLGIQAIERMARDLFGRGFSVLAPFEQDDLLRSIQGGKPAAAHSIWKRMPPRHYWSLLVHDAASAYYSHPWAWDEIGFGGPAYPRGYMRTTGGEPEPWEKREKRYDWLAPADSASGGGARGES